MHLTVSTIENHCTKPSKENSFCGFRTMFEHFFSGLCDKLHNFLPYIFTTKNCEKNIFLILWLIVVVGITVVSR